MGGGWRGTAWMPGGAAGGQEVRALGFSDVLLALLAGFVALVVLPRAARRRLAQRGRAAEQKPKAN